MSLKVVNERENALFSRKEVKFIFENDKIPSKSEAKKMIGDYYSIDSELVRIDNIKGTFGANIITLAADIYDSKESFEKYVTKTKSEIANEKKEAEVRLKAEEEKRKAEEVKKEEAKLEEIKSEEDIGENKD